MVMGWISKEAITFAFNCATGERVYQDKARHIELIDQAQEVVRKRLCVQFQRDEVARAEEVTRAADAVARGETAMPKQYHDVGPTPPKRGLTPQEFESRMQPDDKQSWSMPDFIQGPRDPKAPKRTFYGDPDQCRRIGMWGRVKKNLRKDQMPGNGPNGESIVYADFRRNQPIYVSDETGDG
jgi:hypothetical protein